ncbi:MAG: isopentenyl phosphate kinase [Candidatus Heimdallarchaeota archaeon]
MEIDLIIKIGGSCLSNKALLYKAMKTQDPEDIKYALQLNLDVIDQIGAEISNILQETPKMIILTGVGSPGHFTVLKYNLHKGHDGTLKQRVGFLEAQIAVNRLRQEFLESLLRHGVPAIQLYASSMYQSNNRRILKGNVENLSCFLDVGMIPVISGDMVPDQSLGYSVLSGDQILYDLTKHFRPKTVIFGSDVDGVFTADPKLDPNARLLPEISKETIDELVSKKFQDDDASGQMKGKLSEIKNLIESGLGEILLLNLTVKGNLTQAIKFGVGNFTRIS